MELKVDDAVLEESLSEGMKKTMAKVFESYEVNQAFEKLVIQDVLSGVMASAVKEASSDLDIKELSAVLAKEMVEAVSRGTRMILRESVVDMVFRMRYGDNYEVNENVARKAIAAELFPAGEIEARQ